MTQLAVEIADDGKVTIVATNSQGKTKSLPLKKDDPLVARLADRKKITASEITYQLTEGGTVEHPFIEFYEVDPVRPRKVRPAGWQEAQQAAAEAAIAEAEERKANAGPNDVTIEGDVARLTIHAIGKDG